MNPKRRGNLTLGSAVVEMLLPHRRPLLMVDFIRSYGEEPRPTLEAGRHVTTNETFLQGHFPGMPIWPGALTMEGLGQSASLLLLLTMLRRRAAAAGDDPEAVLEALRNLDRGFRMHAGFRSNDLPYLTEALHEYRNRAAVGAAVEMKFVRPVFPGCRLDYRVEWTDDLGDLVRFSTEASVEGETVAQGTLTGAQIVRPFLG